MLDHMSSSGVMHGDGRQRGDGKGEHEVKKKNISAVHARYRNRGKEILFSDPLVVQVRVAIPSHQVLKGVSSAVLSRINDLIHFIFFLIFDQIWG